MVTWTYDAARRQIAISDPLSRQSRTGYDAPGQTVALTDTAGITSTRRCDLAGQPQILLRLRIRVLACML